jgi:hypothetical protein
MFGLFAMAAGFLGASIDPGSGPRTVVGSLTVGPFYLPPLLVALVALVIAALVHSGVRWMPAAGAMLAIVFLVGSATIGAPAVSYRLTHPGGVVGFVEDWLQVIGETLAAVAGTAATVHLIRGRGGDDRS